MSTKSLVAAIRRKHPGKNYEIREHPAALLANAREPIREEIRQLNAELNVLNTQIKATDEPALMKRLMEAAQFVVDVNGGDPSIPQLARAAEPVNTLRDQRERWREVQARRNHLSNVLSGSRFTVTVWRANSMFATQIAHGDTLAECEARVRDEESVVV